MKRIIIMTRVILIGIKDRTECDLGHGGVFKEV